MFLNYLSSQNINESSEIDDIYSQYTDYVITHKENVVKAYEWLREHCLEIFDKIDEKEFQEQITEHDDSKFSDEEFKPYAERWFGNGRRTPEYDAAWEHHWKNNKHHPEFWEGKDMPAPFILEMICDWLSFGIKENNPGELLYFYENKAKDDPEKNLSEDTKKHIDEYLTIFKSALAN